MFCVRIWDISENGICKEVKYETRINSLHRLRYAAVARGLRRGGRANFDCDA